MKTGVSSNIERKTIKQIRDTKLRNKAINKKAQRNQKGLIGNLRYFCSHCKNSVVFKEKIGDRKIMCSKCNQGFYKNKESVSK